MTRVGHIGLHCPPICVQENTRATGYECC